MDTKDRQLIEQVVKAAGEAGEKGFDFMVQYTWTTGVIDFFGYAAWIAVAVFIGKKLYAWQPENRYDSEIAHFFRGAGMLLCVLVVMGSIAGEAEAIAKILQPAGATIHSVVK